MHCLLLPLLFCGVCVYGSFCCAILSVVSSFAIISLGKREIERTGCFTLIAFKCHLTVSVLCLFLIVCLQCVILALPGHIYFCMCFFCSRKFKFKSQHLKYCQQGSTVCQQTKCLPWPSCYPVRNPIKRCDFQELFYYFCVRIVCAIV